MPDQDSHHAAAVLIVEDEQDLLELLRYSFEREGYQVATAATGEDAMRITRSQPLDLILLDLMLPGMSGLEVCRTLKSRNATAGIAVIMLTARGEEADIVRGLELGADDYVTKPFSPRVLLARVEAVLRRRGQEQTPAGDDRVIHRGGVMIDRDRHQVFVEGQPTPMSVTELKLLALLASKPGRVFTRQQIIDGIHEGFAAVTERSVDVQIVALRKKLGEAGVNIETVRGVGYRFKDG